MQLFALPQEIEYFIYHAIFLDGLYCRLQKVMPFPKEKERTSKYFSTLCRNLLFTNQLGTEMDSVISNKLS